MPNPPTTYKDVHGRRLTIQFDSDPTVEDIHEVFQRELGPYKAQAKAKPAVPRVSAIPDKDYTPPYGPDGNAWYRSPGFIAREAKDTTGIAGRVTQTGKGPLASYRFDTPTQIMSPHMPTYKDARAGLGTALLAAPALAVGAAIPPLLPSFAPVAAGLLGGTAMFEAQYGIDQLLKATDKPLVRRGDMNYKSLQEDEAAFRERNPIAAELTANALQIPFGNPFSSSITERFAGAGIGSVFSAGGGYLNRDAAGVAQTWDALGKDAVAGAATGFAFPGGGTDGESPRARGRAHEIGGKTVRHGESVPHNAEILTSPGWRETIPLEGGPRLIGKYSDGREVFVVGTSPETGAEVLAFGGEGIHEKFKLVESPKAEILLEGAAFQRRKNGIRTADAPGTETDVELTDPLLPDANVAGYDWAESYKKFPQISKPDATEFSRFGIEDFTNLKESIAATFPRLDEDQVHNSAVLVESLARGSAKQQGISTKEWYRKNLSGITRGGETLSQEFAEHFNGVMALLGKPELGDALPHQFSGVTERINVANKRSTWVKPMDVNDARQVLVSLMSHDVSTVPHELAHIFQRSLQGPDAEILNQWVGAKAGKWRDTHDERFAPAYERWLQTSDAPHPSLHGVFAKFRIWLTDLYATLKNFIQAEDFPDEVKDLFKRYHADVSDLTGGNNGERNEPTPTGGPTGRLFSGERRGDTHNHVSQQAAGGWGAPDTRDDNGRGVGETEAGEGSSGVGGGTTHTNANRFEIETDENAAFQRRQIGLATNWKNEYDDYIKRTSIGTGHHLGAASGGSAPMAGQRPQGTATGTTGIQPRGNVGTARTPEPADVRRYGTETSTGRENGTKVDTPDSSPPSKPLFQRRQPTIPSAPDTPLAQAARKAGISLEAALRIPVPSPISNPDAYRIAVLQRVAAGRGTLPTPFPVRPFLPRPTDRKDEDRNRQQQNRQSPPLTPRETLLTRAAAVGRQKRIEAARNAQSRNRPGPRSLP